MNHYRRCGWDIEHLAASQKLSNQARPRWAPCVTLLGIKGGSSLPFKIMTVQENRVRMQAAIQGASKVVLQSLFVASVTACALSGEMLINTRPIPAALSAPLQ